ncbi:hypothetical protein D3C85_1075930 [compost metagenome]
MTDAINLRDTIAPKSDRINADDFIAGPETVTIAAVKRGDADCPVAIHLTDRKPWYPCKSMRRVLISAWGDNGADWVGKSVTLYCDPSVKFGGVAVGGIRISHLSDIASDLQLSLTATRGKRTPYTVKKLVPAAVVYYPDSDFTEKLPAMKAAMREGKMTLAQVIERCEKTGRLTEQQLKQLEG